LFAAGTFPSVLGRQSADAGLFRPLPFVGYRDPQVGILNELYAILGKNDGFFD